MRFTPSPPVADIGACGVGVWYPNWPRGSKQNYSFYIRRLLQSSLIDAPLGELREVSCCHKFSDTTDGPRDDGCSGCKVTSGVVRYACITRKLSKVKKIV